MLQAFRECGWAAWLGLLLSMVALALGVTGFALSFSRQRSVARALAGAGLCSALLVVGVGVAGRSMGISRTERALTGVDDTVRERILEAGIAEANMCIPVTGGEAGLPLLVSLIALAITFVRRDPDARPA